MTPVAKAISSLLIPLLYANLAGMIAGAVWLGALSQWQVIGIGVLLLFFSPFAIPIGMIPAGILSHFMSLYKGAGHAAKERVMFYCSIGYVILFIALIAAGFFYFVVTHVAATAQLPALLWGATAGIAPFLMWSARDRSNLFIMTIVVAAQLAMIILAVAYVYVLIPGFCAALLLFCLTVAGLAGINAIYEEKAGKISR